MDNTYQVTSYKIYDKTKYKYEECIEDKCTQYDKVVRPNTGEYVLAIEMLNLKELSDSFLKNSIGLKYNDKSLNTKNIKLIDYHDNMIYLSVSSDILKSSHIIFVINTRGEEYNILLGASNYE